MMRYIDLHAHMVSRSTDDYVQMALTGCVAVTEPAFWAGWDRSSADGFEDYFRHLTDFEPKRAAVYGIRHFAWLCLNPKEGEDRQLAREVLRRIPRYLELADGPRHRRDRPESRDAQRDRDLPRPRGPRDRARAADPHPHAAPRGQVQGDEDDRRHPHRVRSHRPVARDDRSRRGAHAPDDPRERILDGAHAVPADEGQPRARDRHVRALRHRSNLRRVGVRLGPEPAGRRAALRPRDAAAWTRRGSDRQDHLPQPDRLPRPVAEVRRRLHAEDCGDGGALPRGESDAKSSAGVAAA